MAALNLQPNVKTTFKILKNELNSVNANPTKVSLAKNDQLLIVKLLHDFIVWVSTRGYSPCDLSLEPENGGEKVNVMKVVSDKALSLIESHSFAKGKEVVLNFSESLSDNEFWSNVSIKFTKNPQSDILTVTMIINEGSAFSVVEELGSIDLSPENLNNAKTKLQIISNKDSLESLQDLKEFNWTMNGVDKSSPVKIEALFSKGWGSLIKDYFDQGGETVAQDFAAYCQNIENSKTREKVKNIVNNFAALSRAEPDVLSEWMQFYLRNMTPEDLSKLTKLSQSLKFISPELVNSVFSAAEQKALVSQELLKTIEQQESEDRFLISSKIRENTTKSDDTDPATIKISNLNKYEYDLLKKHILTNSFSLEGKDGVEYKYEGNELVIKFHGIKDLSQVEAELTILENEANEKSIRPKSVIEARNKFEAVRQSIDSNRLSAIEADLNAKQNLLARIRALNIQRNKLIPISKFNQALFKKLTVSTGNATENITAAVVESMEVIKGPNVGVVLVAIQKERKQSARVSSSTLDTFI